ncbi:Sulfate adenylyltransferase subunit 1 [Chromobacterium violaceum]|uniref:Sulfate adenylyltransferase subunit 1 n=1 Tax=Chromobacterium violaceum TaxID=536 RepID=A0A3S4LKD7_CHRVL|nr:Sulfate adenylyltransferase subunit 1 [Chromobacterium violaceum]
MSHQSELIAGDILEYLSQHENKDMLRFITCGSVDDGKSTLIGRLLHDSKLIFEDQLAAIERDSKNTTPPTRTSTWRCWWTACRPSASRASP